MADMIVYDVEKVKTVARLIEGLSVSGIQNFRNLAAICDILDSGKILKQEDSNMEGVEKDGYMAE